MKVKQYDWVLSVVSSVYITISNFKNEDTEISDCF